MSSRHLGATVLAVMLGRTLRPDEYPRGIGDLVTEVTNGARESGSLRRFFLRSPLKFEPRITSGFSMRRFHPVLGYPDSRRLQ